MRVGFALLFLGLVAPAFGAAAPDLSPKSLSGNYLKARRAAIQYVRKMPASQFDANLKDVTFGDWVDKTLGESVNWEMNDCGESAVGRTTPAPLCVNVQQPANQIDLAVAIGDREHGVVRPARMHHITAGTHKLKNLSEVPGMLTDTGIPPAK